MTSDATIAFDRRAVGSAVEPEPTRLLHTVTPVALVILFAALPSLAAFGTPLSTLDEGLLLVYPEQILTGDVPNRDFFTSYGPGGLSLLASVYAVVGPSVLAERAVGLAYHVAIATGVFAMARRLGRPVAMVSGIVAGLLLVPLGLGAYSWLGALALVTWSLALLDDPRSSRVTLLAGVLGTLAISWRPETAVVVIVSSLPHLWRRHRWRPWLAGAALGALPLAVHAWLGGWRLWTNIAGRVGANSNMRVTISDIDVVLGAIATLLAAAFLAWCAFRHRTARTASWALVSALVLPQMVQRLDVGHVLTVGCLVVPLAIAQSLAMNDVGARLGARSDQVRHGGSPGRGALLLLVALGVPAAMASTKSLPSVVHEARSIPVRHAAEKRTVEHTLRRVDDLVPAGSKIFLGAQDMSVPTLNDIRLYHLLPRHDAFAYNLEMPPPQPQGSALLGDIAEADALILLHVPNSWGRMMVPFIPAGDGAANDLVAERFCIAERAGPYKIYLRCGSGK